MPKPLLFLVSLLFSCACLKAQILIKNTNVLDVENKKILTGYTVLIENDRIVSVDKDRQYKLPATTTIIDGTGKFLIPGLVDAHVHFFQSGSLFTRPDAMDLRKYRPYADEIKWGHEHLEDFLRRYLAAGITSVIDVGSTENFLTQRDSFANKPYAATIYMTGPLSTTWEPPVFRNLGKDEPLREMKTEAEARQLVDDQLPYQPDFIKIWYIVLDSNVEAGARKNLPLVQATIDEAHKNGLRVAVHATQRITAQLAVAAGADYLVHDIDDEIITDEFVSLLKKKNTVLCPTLVVAHNYNRAFGGRYKTSTRELETASPFPVGSILDYPRPDSGIAKLYMAYSGGTALMKQNKADSVMAINVKKLLDAGVPIATGTDAGNIGTQHVSSFFDELDAMKEAGFSNWQLLQSSTLNAAKAMGQEKKWGSISKDKTADLVLLNANPIDDLGNWRKIDLIIHKGQIIAPDTLVHHDALELVQQQLNAYNAHDVTAFLAPYADDAQVYQFPDSLMMNGKESMRKGYSFLNRAPQLHCEIVSRVIQGNTIIDREKITGVTAEPLYGVAIYVIEGGKIRKVYVIQ